MQQVVGARLALGRRFGNLDGRNKLAGAKLENEARLGVQSDFLVGKTLLVLVAVVVGRAGSERAKDASEKGHV